MRNGILELDRAERRPYLVSLSGEETAEDATGDFVRIAPCHGPQSSLTKLLEYSPGTVWQVDGFTYLLGQTQ